MTKEDLDIIETKLRLGEPSYEGEYTPGKGHPEYLDQVLLCHIEMDERANWTAVWEDGASHRFVYPSSFDSTFDMDLMLAIVLARKAAGV